MYIIYRDAYILAIPITKLVMVMIYDDMYDVDDDDDDDDSDNNVAHRK
jgi:hypothetical protein